MWLISPTIWAEVERGFSHSENMPSFYFIQVQKKANRHYVVFVFQSNSSKWNKEQTKYKTETDRQASGFDMCFCNISTSEVNKNILPVLLDENWKFLQLLCKWDIYKGYTQRWAGFVDKSDFNVWEKHKNCNRKGVVWKRNREENGHPYDAQQH